MLTESWVKILNADAPGDPLTIASCCWCPRLSLVIRAMLLLSGLWVNLLLPSWAGCECGPLSFRLQFFPLPSPGGASWHQLHECQIAVLLCVMLSFCSHAAQELSLAGVLSYWILSRCIVHLIKLYLISFVFHPFVSVRRLWRGGREDKNGLNEASLFKTRIKTL